jgi:hypothetical protein
LTLSRIIVAGEDHGPNQYCAPTALEFATSIKTGRRPPPQAAQRGLDGLEHGAKLDQVGSAD